MIYSYHIAMKKAMVSELKNRLSYYLRFVRAGESVLVYDRDQAIARIEPVQNAAADDPGAWIAELERRGALRAPRGKLPANWLEARGKTRANVVGALLDERDSGR
jgi:antitoxin (DNA-binding transcriptional repressor) of toxin-antitoxin stability system